MRKNPHGRILKRKPKKQHINTVPNSYPLSYLGALNEQIDLKIGIHAKIGMLMQSNFDQLVF